MSMVSKLRRRVRVGAPTPLPRHIGLVMDGNRRWARAEGLASPSSGHKAGAEHVEAFLAWCASRSIDHVTIYVLSAANIRKRSSDEIGYLFTLLADTIPTLVLRSERWQLHISGDLALVSAEARTALRQAELETVGRPAHVTLAVGYDGRQDIVEGIRSALRVSGDSIDEESITAQLPGGPVKDIDLVIRTSGETRISGFFPWQAERAEFVFSPALWPAFDQADFEDALRQYADKRSRATKGI